jgi:hypothetical protein
MAQDRNPIRTGSIVEVWNRPLGGSRGRFCVTVVSPTGIRVQPVSEPAPLASTFTADELRPLPEPRTSAAG